MPGFGPLGAPGPKGSPGGIGPGGVPGYRGEFGAVLLVYTVRV